MRPIPPSWPLHCDPAGRTVLLAQLHDTDIQRPEQLVRIRSWSVTGGRPGRTGVAVIECLLMAG